MGRRVLTALILACAVWAAGCSDLDSPGQGGLDTSWHTEVRPLPDKHPSKGRIEAGKHEWRLVRYAKSGETLPGGLKAGLDDVVWEWRMELTNLTDKPIEAKAGFRLVTVDDTIDIARSQDPPEEEKLVVIQPGEKKVFTGQGLIDKKDISRIARGRGLIGAKSTKTRKGER
jgi:hypothetical protein